MARVGIDEKRGGRGNIEEMDGIGQFLKSLHPVLQGIIYSLISAVIIAIFALIIRLIRNTSKEKKETEQKRLRTHFNELYEEIKTTLSEIKISEMYGLIVRYMGGVPQYHPDFVVIMLPEFTEPFRAHFPKETATYKNNITRILKNNQNYKVLRQKIETDFESDSISIVDINSQLTKSPVIYDNIFWPLFSWWDARSKGKTKPSPNFNQIETTADFGPNHLVVSGWNSSAIAYAVEPADKQKCIEIITRIAHKVEYENEAARIIYLANEIIKDFRDFNGQLIETLNDISKLWPGIRNHKFKKEKKKCPRCKEIFS